MAKIHKKKKKRKKSTRSARSSILNLPDPKKVKLRPRRKRGPKCPVHRQRLSITRGWGWCDICCRGLAVPIGRLASRGHHKGKYIYTRETVLRELHQDEDRKEAEYLLGLELKKRDYFIINENEEEY